MQTKTNEIMELRFDESVFWEQFAKVKFYLISFGEFVEEKTTDIKLAFDKLLARIKNLPEVYVLTHGSWKGNPAPKLSSSDKALAVVSLVGSTAFLSVAAALA